ncbi:MAG: hypothetical protein WAL25_02895 [Acidimicrobiia bacterium]|jgi:hypothetical protein
MTAYDARLKIEGEDSPPLAVTVDLTGDHLKMIIGEEEVADWARENMRISAMPDGFHIRAEGEAVVLDVTDDARFAVELGLRNAHPALRQRMAALLRSDEPTT